jgi:hypothetical protein
MRIFSDRSPLLDTYPAAAQSSQSPFTERLNLGKPVAKSAVVQQVIASFLDQLSKNEQIPTDVVETLRAAASAGTLGQAQTIKTVRARIKEKA